MNEEERDIVEFVDEDGNELLLEVVDCFYYNGEEYAVLSDVEDGCECEHGCDCGCAHDKQAEGEHAEDDHEHALYIMKIETSIDEDGEEVEEFIPVEDSLMESLIEIVQNRFFDDEEDEDDDLGDAYEDDEDASDGEES